VNLEAEVALAMYAHEDVDLQPMTATMARRPFAITSQSFLVFAAFPEANRRLHVENMSMIVIMARRPFAISSQNLLVFAAGSQKPTGACTQRTCR